MVNRPALARFALFLIVFALLITPGSATSTIMSEGGFPEVIPDDPTLEYVWNIPLKLVLLDFVFMAAPLLFLPVQFLISVSVWLILGQRRISRKNALEHETRRAAYLCVRENPGINHAALSRMLGINVGTLRYHIEILCETGQIVSESNHGVLRYYTGIRAARESKRSAYPLNEMRKRMLGLLMQNPGMTRKEVASALDVTGATVTWHMGLLIREGTIRSEKDGRMVRYYPQRDIVRPPGADRGVDATG